MSHYNYYDWRKWTRRRDLTIGEFEDIWDSTNRYEVAEGLLSVLPAMEGISHGDKINFLTDLVLLIREINEPAEDDRLRNVGADPDKLKKHILLPAVRAFFEIVPSWDRNLDDCCRKMLVSLSYLTESKTLLERLGSKIKKFVHSCLNICRKEEIDEMVLAKVLINCGMFEELANYNFVSDATIDCLARQVLNRPITSHFKYFVGEIKEPILAALKENREPHALSVLLRLLAKRGDLEKIFKAEKAEEIKKAE